MSKGLNFENKVVEYFRSQGYLAKRGIALTTNGKQDATDIDVYGIKFIYPFVETTLICDCKDKARPKPFERLFWTKGLAEYVRVNNIYVALPKVQTDIAAFASDINVNILNKDQINSFDSNIFSYGLGNIDSLEKDKNFTMKYNAIKQLYIYRNPYSMLNKCLIHIQSVSKEIKIIKIEDKNKYINLLSELMVLLSISILRICSKLMSLDNTNREAYLMKKLTYGEMPADKANMILENVSILAYEVIKKETGRVKVDMGDFNFIKPPEYASDIIGLISRAIEKPQSYLDLPQIMDYVMFELVLDNKKFNEEEFKNIFGNLLYNEKIKSCKNIIHLVNKYFDTQIDIEKIFN